ncbi:MAG: hypothetical protein R2881_08755 [Eubacteriales bacterium]
MRAGGWYGLRNGAAEVGRAALVVEDESWIVIRPSGTEPKLKLYIGARAKTKEQLEEKLAALLGDVDALLKGYLG